MCISPTMLHPKGYFYAGSEPVLIPCRICWQCKLNRVQMWTGRNLAEAQMSTVSYAVTLTYGRDWNGDAEHVSSVLLMYDDIQKLLKRMRDRGYSVRYIIAGEYGSSTERAHWHGVFHFSGDKLPQWEGEHLTWTQEKWDRVGGIHIPEWAIYGKPLGFVHIKKATYAHVRYALKYLLKDQYDPYKQNVFHMSKKPPLGKPYFQKLAYETAQAGLPIQDMRYHFDVRLMSGEEKRMSFMLSGQLAKEYLDDYMGAWRSIHGNDRWPTSDVLEMYEQWGKLGNEDMMTAKRNAELPEPGSIFNSDGTLKSEQAKKPAGFHAWLREQDEAARLKKVQDRKEREANEPEKVRQRQQANARSRHEAVRLRGAQAGLSEAEYERLPKSWRAFIADDPASGKSLLARAAADRERCGPAKVAGGRGPCGPGWY